MEDRLSYGCDEARYGQAETAQWNQPSRARPWQGRGRFLKFEYRGDLNSNVMRFLEVVTPVPYPCG
jgi:hypothetical protein